jgi:hypothetical protein
MHPWPRQVLKFALFAWPVLLLSGFLYRPQTTDVTPMSSIKRAEEIATVLLQEHGLRLKNMTPIQSLWAGYGQISRVTATADISESVSSDTNDGLKPHEEHSFVLKLITPPPARANDEGHTRKILSYQVEQYFYRHLAPQLPSSLPVARCLASVNQHDEDGTSTTAMMLSDLKQQFPVAGEKRNVLTSTQVYAALDWLSGFHGFWWSRVEDLDRLSLILPPLEEVRHDGQDIHRRTVWLNGGYTYLSTRRKEFADLAADDDSEWSTILTQQMKITNMSISEMVANLLAPVISGSSPANRYQTLIHGDVKSENLFTSESGEEVAFYDFQYTGLGLGVCDLAKLFTCSVPLSMLVEEKDISHELSMQNGERVLLERYRRRLKDVGQREYEWNTFVLHWEIALIDWLRFQASWGFWGNTEWLEARARSILKDPHWKKTVVSSVLDVDEVKQGDHTIS